MTERRKPVTFKRPNPPQDAEEIPAEGVVGFLLYNPFTDRHFFRVYDETDRRKYEDYAVHAEDIEVKILAGGLSLYRKTDDKNSLNWSSEVLGRAKIPTSTPERKVEGYLEREEQ